MKIRYEYRAFHPRSRHLIDRANEVITRYQDMGITLTLRQLYYQLVSLGHIKNTEKSYRSLGQLISNARICGKISWTAIVDRERECVIPKVWSNAGRAIQSAADNFKIDLWKNQKFYVEVWVEKKSLIEIVASQNTPYFACKGYTSSSSIWEAAQRLRRKAGLEEIDKYIGTQEPSEQDLNHQIEENLRQYGENFRKWPNWTGKFPVILYLGDHDPLGLDITRDIQERLQLFRAPAIIKRIGLNLEQIKRFGVSPNPSRVTDSRFSEYKYTYGDKSWELDALDPEVLRFIVQDAINNFRDEERWKIDLENQEKEREKIIKIASEINDRRK